MNHLTEIANAEDYDRRVLFQTTADRLVCDPANIEKDFWVCWTLDALFNKCDLGPRLLFKGGTSLSKVFGLISRFSEDIDITVFRDDLDPAGFPTDTEFTAMGRRPRDAHLDRLRASCQKFIGGPLRAAIERIAAEELAGAPVRFTPDADDRDGQSLLFHYPTVFPDAGSYVRRVVKIESGARSAVDPHRMGTIKPYVAEDVPDLDLAVGNVRTVSPIRTFWDKIVILHGQRRWFEICGEVYKNGDRVSRHYYDVHQFMRSDLAEEALADREMAADCVQHARLFFDRGPLDLGTAKFGTFALAPPEVLRKCLEADYKKMVGMVFGSPPSFSALMDSVGEAESALNAGVRYGL